MLMPAARPAKERSDILLVIDDAALRRRIHLLLAAHDYHVRSHAVVDRAARDDSLGAAGLLIVAAERPGNAAATVGAMRAIGWRGPSLLLARDGGAAPAGRHAGGAGFTRLDPAFADHQLIGCVASLLGGHPVAASAAPAACAATGHPGS